MGLVAAATGSQAAAIGTEHSLTQQTGIGIYVLMVDASAMLADDVTILRLKTKLNGAATSRVAYEYTLSGAQVAPNWYSVPVPVDTEIICTLQQTTGTARTYPWKLLRA
jgi:hypothetical protein